MRAETRMSYQEKVFDYLEYIGYPQYVMEFEPEPVAKTLVDVIGDCYHTPSVSHRMCAIMIFSLTMIYQVMRYDKKAVN